MKVSDEFTVPLCRGHHRQLHQAGNEITWWEGLKINPLEIAKGLWEQTHPKSAAVYPHFSTTRAAVRPNFGSPEGRFFRLAHAGGLVAPTWLSKLIGVLLPIAPWGRSSL